MLTKTIEGMIGAGANYALMNTPMRVYREAKSEAGTDGQGNVAVMERAMGYAEQFSESAAEYEDKTTEGLKEEAAAEREARAKENSEAAKKPAAKSENKVENARTDEAVKSADGETEVQEVHGENTAPAPESKGEKDRAIYTKTGQKAPEMKAADISITV